VTNLWGDIRDDFDYNELYSHAHLTWFGINKLPRAG